MTCLNGALFLDPPVIILEYSSASTPRNRGEEKEEGDGVRKK